MRQPALIRDDRQELSHFWVYPLLTAPVMVMSDALGAHPLLAFVLTNAALLTAAVLVVTRVFGVSSALMLLASPLGWIYYFPLIWLTVAAAVEAVRPLSARWVWWLSAVFVLILSGLPYPFVLGRDAGISVETLLVTSADTTALLAAFAFALAAAWRVGARWPFDRSGSLP